MTRIWKWLLLGAVVLAPVSLRAQTSVYGDISLTNYGYKADSNSTEYSYRGDASGFGGGVTWLFPSDSRLKAGVDARFSYSPGKRGGDDGSAALRIAFVPRVSPLRPYFQIGGGVVHVPGAYFSVVSNSGTYVSQGE